MIEQITNSWVCWLMLLLALYIYQQLWMDYLHLLEAPEMAEHNAPEYQRKITALKVGALPLMGLFGTITGLQDSFTGMMLGGADSQMVTNGIAHALFTTQLGLVLAIPGWLLLVFVNAKGKSCYATTTAR
ncbi:MotA/TolQ/ExbB proton channel family protein [Gilvimarinus xylanilyticus]|uniref:MotA/TolQ/ExbB proton channel family protein n=1 Tax=Gilvimarinus xylanilyticus TaxID=2944139 RepID=A0A9X2I7J5_9GAMM|nr:MotA/TolQ/ExbB proton channel family protein [Gilvimarinus xylanilyticus]MCP8900892.1 MotA/TolQ/ExbB proton channel family protein [Gilvimarinus xylanilyticus]